MEEGNDRQRYCTEVSLTAKVRLNTEDHFFIDKTNEKEQLADAYSSDGESSSGCTDQSNSTDFRTDFQYVEVAGKQFPFLPVDVFDVNDFKSVPELIKHRIDSKLETGSFLVTNLAAIIAQLNQWKSELPMVTPFYAVKCNPDPMIVTLLAHLGCSFDCATMGEIDLVLHGLGDLSFGQRGLATSSIVYANPAKMEHMLEYAIQHGVEMTVFDGEDELHKMKSLPGHEKLKLLLRLTTDDRASVCRFSKKFGCPVEEAPRLLDVAKELGLNVAGVSFHVGSGCGDANAYVTALEHARIVFDYGDKIGMSPMSIIDLGGGFPGDTGGYGGPGMPTFQDIAAAIRKGIDSFTENFQRPIESLRFIAEPGRYFVSASTTICTRVYARKGGLNKYQALYVDDGVYGSFNNVVYDHACPVPMKLSNALDRSVVEESIPTAVFGPTCDGLDQMCSLETTNLPRCEIGEWLIWENQGAYTHTASFVFNGYTHFPKKTYCYI